MPSMTCRALTALVATATLIAALGAQAPNQTTRVSTLTVRVHKLEPSTHGLFFYGPDGLLQGITVPSDVALYDELAEGDLIVVDYIEAVVVELKPRASLTGVEDTTAAAQAAAIDSPVKIDQQLKAVVTVERVDQTAGTVVYYGKDNRRVLRAIQDPALLRGLKAGDVVEVTMTRARAVRLARAPM